MTWKKNMSNLGVAPKPHEGEKVGRLKVMLV